MAYDPLSLQTRKDRRALLAFSAVAVVVEVFGVEIKDIPGAGIEIVTPEALLPVVLIVGIVYLMLAFSLHLIDDRWNTEPSPYLKQRDVEDARSRTEREEAFLRNANDYMWEAAHASKGMQEQLGSLNNLLTPYMNNEVEGWEPEKEQAHRQAYIASLIEQVHNRRPGMLRPADSVFQELIESARDFQPIDPSALASRRNYRWFAEVRFFALEGAIPFIMAFGALLLLGGVINGPSLLCWIGLTPP